MKIQQADHSPLEICRRRKNRLENDDCICEELLEAIAGEQEKYAKVCDELAVQALKNAYRSGFAYLFYERTLAKRLSECFNEAAGKIRGES